MRNVFTSTYTLVVLACLVLGANAYLRGRTLQGATCVPTCITMAPSNTEGSLSLSPGVPIYGGFNLKVTGSDTAVTNLTIVSGYMNYFATCGTQEGASVPFEAGIASQSFLVPPGNQNSFPTSYEASPDTFQTGMIWVPNLCNGQALNFANGAAFTGCFTSDQPNTQVQVQFHYHPNDSTAAPWSQTESVTITSACTSTTA